MIPVPVNPEAIGDPNQTPRVQLGPLHPCAAGSCDRLVSAMSRYCCALCAEAWEAPARYEPHEHSEGCDQRDRARRPASHSTQPGEETK